MNAIGMNAIGIALVWCMLQVTMACTTGALVYLVARKTGRAAGRMTAIAPLAMVLVLTAVVLSPWPSWLSSGPVLSSKTAAPSEQSAKQHALQGNEQSSAVADSVATAETTPSHSIGPLNLPFWQSVWTEMQQTLTNADRATTVASSAWRWPAIVAIVFLVTSAAGLLRLLFAWRALRRLNHRSMSISNNRLTQLVSSISRDLSLSRAITVKESSELQTAATFGWRQPVLLLPVDWSEWPKEELRAVIAHELTHVARGDFASWLVAQLAVAMHFYHPLVHWLAGRLRLEQELAADASAAQFAGGREIYLQSLAALTLRADNLRPGWAAQTFLPTRTMFVRRIEMLKRTNSSPQEKLNGKARFAVISVLTAIGLFAGGLRPPGLLKVIQLNAAEPASEDPELKVEEVPLSAMDPAERAAFDARVDMCYIPENALYVVRVRPAEIFKDIAMKAAAEELSQLLAERPGGDVFSVEEFDTILMTSYSTEQGTPGMRVMFRTVEQVSQTKADRFIKTGWLSAPVQVPRGPFSYFHQKGDPEGLACWSIGDQVFLFDTTAASLKRYLDRLKSADSRPLTWLGDTKPDAKTQLWWALNAQKIVLPREHSDRRGLIGGFPLQMVSPLFRDMQRVLATVQIAPVFRLTADARCPSPEAAMRVEETTGAMLVMLRNMLAEQVQAELPEGTPAAAIVPTLKHIQPLLDSVQIEATGSDVKLTVSSDFDVAKWIQKFLLITQAGQNTSRRIRSQNNLRQIALALNMYHDKHGHFPPAVLYDKESGIPYSWRVAILPYLKQKALYDRYHFDEPWDSEQNRLVLESRPVQLLPPTVLTETNTSYFALTGPETVFAGRVGVKLRQIPDGTSNTLLVVEAKRDIPWTKPEDIPYKRDGPMPKLGGFYEGGFNVAFCDASARFVSENIDEQTLRHLIEKSDGNVVERSKLQK